MAGSIFRRSPSPVGPGTRAKAPYALTYKNPIASGSGSKHVALHQFCKILRALSTERQASRFRSCPARHLSATLHTNSEHPHPSSAPCFIQAHPAHFIQAHPAHLRFPALHAGSHQGELVLQLGGRPQDAQGVGRQLGVGRVYAPCGQQGVRTAAQGEGGVP